MICARRSSWSLHFTERDTREFVKRYQCGGVAKTHGAGNRGIGHEVPGKALKNCLDLNLNVLCKGDPWARRMR